MSDRLRAMFCDHLSIMRGKYLPAAKSGDDETRFCRSTFGVHFDKDLLPSPGSLMLEGLPDMQMRWNEADVRDGWEPNTKVVIGDLYDQDGEPVGQCGRGALRRAIAAWQLHGLTPKVGIELEAYAFTRDEDGKLVPYDSHGVVYGTGPFTDPLRFTDAIWAKGEELGFHVDMITAEYDSPQFEFTLTFDEALKAVDDIVLFRQMAREIAFEKGIYLTFMPKPIEEAGGNGMHVNFSFTDDKGKNAFDNGPVGGPENLTDVAKGCIAGLLHHHRGLAGLLAPSNNSYHRLSPGSLSGYWKNWGGDHRNVTTRVSGEGGGKARLEHRMADASANVYTAVAAVLQASRLGYENKLDLIAMETGDGFETNDATEGTANDLITAMKDLETDTALSGAVGQELVDNQIFMRMAEAEKTSGLSIEEQRNFYAFYI